jgi:predicted dehydrogenase
VVNSKEVTRAGRRNLSRPSGKEASTLAVYRAAIVGCGRMGGFIDDEVRWACSSQLPYSHGLAYVESPLTELVAGCDPDQQKLRQWGERYGIRALYTDVSRMMAETAPDMVSVCTPTAGRYEATLAVAAGRPKAVFVEKPIAECLREADEMIAACEGVGAVTAINTSRRWHQTWHRAAELIARGEIGRPRTAVTYGVAGISHNGSHLIDTLRYLLGDDVDWLVGHIDDEARAATEDDCTGLALLHFRGGTHAYLNMIDPAVTSFEIDVVGEQGRVRVSCNGLEAELWTAGPNLVGLGMNRQPFPWPVRPQSFALLAIEDIVAAVEQRRPARCTMRDGRAALEVAVALRESHRRGGVRIPLPFEDRETRIKAP